MGMFVKNKDTFEMPENTAFHQTVFTVCLDKIKFQGKKYSIFFFEIIPQYNTMDHPN